MNTINDAVVTETNFELDSYYKNMLTRNFFITMQKCLCKVFKSDYGFKSSEEWYSETGTMGWYDALNDACNRCGIPEFVSYWDSLDWRDCDECDAMIVKMATENLKLKENMV